MDSPPHAVVCHQCAFWTNLNARDGTCRRHAPHTGSTADEVTHWPLTHRDDQCGEGVAKAKGTAKPGTACGRCIYWRPPPEGGFLPYDRRDQFSDWWAHAGHCTRFAPGPSAQPGNRAFWRVTHETDACSDGAARQ